MTFIDRCIAGEIKPAEIDDAIDDWHDGDSELGLAEYLGLTSNEYYAWVKDAVVISSIVAKRKKELK